MARKKDAVSRMTGMITGFAGRIILMAVMILLLFRGVTIAYSFGHELLYEHGMEAAPGTSKTIEIQSGDGSAEIADTLLAAGLIDNKTAFQVQAVLYEAEFAPGSYELNTSMTVAEILEYLSSEAVKMRELEQKNLTGGTTETGEP